MLCLESEDQHGNLLVEVVINFIVEQRSLYCFIHLKESMMMVSECFEAGHKVCKAISRAFCLAQEVLNQEGIEGEKDLRFFSAYLTVK